MPDSRTHRGAHPEDARDFSETALPALRTACTELSWLLSRDYAEVAALKLVGDQHQLTARQRRAVLRAAASEQAVARRRSFRRDAASLAGDALAIDGFNCLITLESMLSGAPVFVGRDGAVRDLASVHGTYRTVDETRPAVMLLARALARVAPRTVTILLDRPVGNSGRLRGVLDEILTEVLRDTGTRAIVELSDTVDRTLSELGTTVASSDSWVIDHATAWVDLPDTIARDEGLSRWTVDLREPLPSAHPSS